MADPARKSPAEAQREAKAREDADTKAKAAVAAQQQQSDAADSGQSPEQTPSEPEAAPTPVQDDAPKYGREDLLAGARTQLGYGKYVVAGALSTMEGDEFTIEEVRAAVEKFAGQPLDENQPENLDEPRKDENEESEG